MAQPSNSRSGRHNRLSRRSTPENARHRLSQGTLKKKIKQQIRDRLGIEYGRYLYTVTHRRLQILRHFGVQLMIDVGANSGQYAGALRASGYDGSILSFEPTNEPYQALALAAAGDPKWECRQIAVSDAPGELDFHLTRLSVFNSALRAVNLGEGHPPGPEVIGHERVVADTLDNILADFSTSDPLAIKIDVQGFERQVLLGAPETLKRAAVVEMELSAAQVYDAPHMLIAEAIQRMSDIGLVLSLVENIVLDRPTGRSVQFNGIFARFST